MSRKSVALFLATTGLMTSLAGCGVGQDAKERGDEGGKPSQSAPALNRQGDNGEEGQKEEDKQDDTNHKQDKGDKRDEGGEGGEGGEG